MLSGKDGPTGWRRGALFSPRPILGVQVAKRQGTYVIKCGNLGYVYKRPVYTVGGKQVERGHSRHTTQEGTLVQFLVSGFRIHLTNSVRLRLCLIDYLRFVFAII